MDAPMIVSLAGEEQVPSWNLQGLKPQWPHGNTPSGRDYYTRVHGPWKFFWRFHEDLPMSLLDHPDDVVTAKNQESSILNAVFGVTVAVAVLRGTLALRKRNLRQVLFNYLVSAPQTTSLHQLFRTVLNESTFHQRDSKAIHSHPNSMQARRDAKDYISNAIKMMGRTEYHYQTSQSENDKDALGTRDYHWAKDMTQVFKNDDVPEGAVISMIDVDYYVDMPSFLLENERPVLIYTIQPEAAGETLPESSFSLADDCIDWHVKGGGRYQHKIWNYGLDWFTVTKFFMGIPIQCVLYDVTAIRVSPHRQVVLLSPMRRAYGVAAICMHAVGRPLARCKFTVGGGFNKVKVWKSNGDVKVSVSRAGSSTSATISQTAFDTLLATKRNSPKELLTQYQVKSLIKNESDVKESIAAPILCDYYNNSTDDAVTLIHVAERPAMVQFAHGAPDPSDKPILTAFGKPFVPPAFVPVNNVGNSNASIIGRVVKPKEAVKKLELKLTPFKDRAMEAFLERLIPEPHKMVPVDYVEVAARQTKPGQKRDLTMANFLEDPKKTATTFMKPEAYGKPGDPRNITTFNGKVKCDYAGFMYPLMDYLKTFDFYAFGKPPQEVAQRVAHIAVNAKRVIHCPDIRRMDGYVNWLCRRLERALGLRLFHPDYHADFIKAHDAHYDNRGITSFGFFYEQGETRGSGEMGTSAWNTILTAFTIYLAVVAGNGGNHDKAWEYLLTSTIVGGDDSVVSDIDADHLVRQAKNMGFEFTIDTFHRGEQGVNFLARVYGPDVWTGDPTSICDIKRQMEKLHLAPNVNVTPEQKLIDKCVSFSLTDGNTPVIGDLCKRVLDLNPGAKPSGLIKRYGDEWPIEKQYPNVYSDWMLTSVINDLELLRVDELTSYIKGAKTTAELLDPPCFYDEGREFTYADWDATPGVVLKPEPVVEGKDLETATTTTAT